MTKFFRKFWSSILILTICLVNFYPPLAYDASAVSCSDLVFIFARGSGEALDGPSYTAWKNENLAAIERQNLNLSYSFYELGSASQFGAQYPAVAVSGNLAAVGNLLGAFVSGGAAFNFGESVEEGAKELLNYIGKVSATCPETKFVLGGYSQGAMLISRSLGQINPDKIIYVATFGDPKLYLPEGKGKRPLACSGKNLSNYRDYVSDCHAYEGVLGSYRPYQPTGYYNKLGTYCNAQDIMCSSGMSIADHTAYTERGLYQLAAQTIARHVRAVFRPDTGQDSEDLISTHDLLIIFDITNGMRAGIDNYLAELRTLVHQTRSLGGRIALYTVWQQRDIWPTMRPVILEACDFTCSPEELDYQISRLNSLSSGATMGGLPIYMALNQSMQKLNWQIGATKTAVVFTSERPRAVDHDGTTLEDIINLSLAIDPVNVFAITDSESVAESFRPLTDATNGKTRLLSAESGSLADEILGRPAAKLALETYSGIVGDEFIFDASASNIENADLGLRYDWDLDTDGTFELQDAGATVHRVYSAPVSGFIQVRITDKTGYSSTMSAKLEVTATEPVPATISELKTTLVDAQTFRIDFQTDAAHVLVVLNDSPLGWIDSKASSSFTLTDISEASTLRLIPYSAANLRGEAASITLDSSVQPSTPGQSEPNQPSDSSSSSQELPAQRPPLKYQPSLVPKAPNTGYFAD